MVKNPPAMWETWVQFLGWEDPLEEGMATHPSTLAWRILWTEKPGRLQSLGSQRVGHHWVTKHSTQHSHYIKKKKSLLEARMEGLNSMQFSRSVVSDSLRTPWIAARQASLSITNSRSPLTLTSMESPRWQQADLQCLCWKCRLSGSVPSPLHKTHLNRQWFPYFLNFDKLPS